jgi:molybdopterin-binding protein
MKLSARNQLVGAVREVRIKIEVHNPAILTAIIALEAFEEPRLRVGHGARAVIKASDVVKASQTSRSGRAA